MSVKEIAILRAAPHQAGDLSEIARLAKAHWDYPAEWLDRWRNELTLTEAWVRENEVYAAMLGDRVVGLYALEGELPLLQLEHFWVLPDWIGRGVGRRLLEHALERARARGALTLEVDSDPNAEGYYLRLGGRRVGQLPAPMPGAPDRFLPRLHFDL